MGIRMKVPYKYKEFEHSRLATEVDRWFHKPSSAVWVMFIALLLPGYFYLCFSALMPKEAQRVIGYVCAVFVLVGFVGSFFLGAICDMCKISERVARWDIAGRNYTGKMKLIIVVLILVLILPGIIAGAVSLVNGLQADSYHATMYVLADPDSVPVEGDKAVTLADATFTRLYIPESLQAEEPEQVRYILYCTDEDELVGFYGDSYAAGYQRCREIEIVDRESGETVATKLFRGGMPSYSISDGEGSQYGSEPDEETIRLWVAEVLQAD